MTTESFGRRLQSDFRDLLVCAADLFHRDASLWDGERRLRAVIDRIVTPFDIAVFGRVKAGKSSIVNALLGRRLAVVFSEEATATVNVITHVDAGSDLLNRFTVHWTDRPPETFPLERLQLEWTGKDDALLGDRVRRTNYLELYSDAECLKLHEIIDTPGIGSAVVEHEQVTQAFLQGARTRDKTPDAMIYVIESVAKLSDLESIEKFRDSCMPGSDPYNTVGVLHKWDNEYFQHGMAGVLEKCRRLRSRFEGVLADVIPVSAPLAFFAANASEADLRDIAALLARYPAAELTSALADQDDWDDADDRKQLRLRFRNAFDCPWASFRILVRERCEHPRRTAVAYRDSLLEISGFATLRNFLDSRFFRRSALIRQRQAYVQVSRIFAEAKGVLWEKDRTANRELGYWRQLHCPSDGSGELRGWINRNIRTLEKGAEDARELCRTIERELEGHRIIQALDDVTLREWCADNEFDFIVRASGKLIGPVLDTLSGYTADAKVSLEALEKFYERLCTLVESGIDPAQRRAAERLQLRILDYVALGGKNEEKHVNR